MLVFLVQEGQSYHIVCSFAVATKTFDNDCRASRQAGLPCRSWSLCRKTACRVVKMGNGQRAVPDCETSQTTARVGPTWWRSRTAEQTTQEHAVEFNLPDAALEMHRDVDAELRVKGESVVDVVDL
ncbi:unnamed protein product [Symbiodinium natans]|uniref:Uncharacterized protein n=1 Tax=Symbiodinium natans TaxID=878477 RepID=A0A812IDW0_9DINO|nr:unnamed protein product [Symbiodinium natans]